jgi:adenylate kinase
MRRIIVVGCQGSGKTSLAVKLERELCLPVVHLDVLYWRPGWKASDKASFRVRDSLFVIERPRRRRLWRIARRSAFGRDGTRPDLPEGCPPEQRPGD